MPREVRGLFGQVQKLIRMLMFVFAFDLVRQKDWEKYILDIEYTVIVNWPFRLLIFIIIYLFGADYCFVFELRFYNCYYV